VADFEINDLDAIGQVNDVEPHLLPPEAFTVLLNVRCRKNGLEVTLGWETTMVPSGGSRMFAPHFALPVQTPSQTYWLYTSLTKAAVFNGTSDFDLTRSAGGDYAANESHDWNGVVLGGIPILNNGVDVPQYWSAYNTATKLTALPNWTSTIRAKIIRNYGSFLVAFNITDTGVNYPHLVQWSHPADPGTVPSSWAYSDPTKDGGRKDLPDVNSGEIKEALQLQDTMYVYKERSIWKMKFIGGRFIMDFGSGPWLEGVGIIAARCVCVFADGSKHCVATKDDIIWHNGNAHESILTGRQRKTLFEQIDLNNVQRSFMFAHPREQEVWFCYPETGQTYPNKALVWKHEKGKGAITFVDGVTFRNAVRGDIEGASTEIWDSGTDTWDMDTGPWSEIFRQQIVLCDPTASKLFQLDKSNTKNGTPFSPSIIRQGLGIMGKKRNGEIIEDIRVYKFVDSIWPKANGAAFRIRVGYQDNINSGVTWQPYVSFNPSADRYVNPFSDEDLPGSGVLWSIEFSATTGAQWRLDGYKVDVHNVGVF
jgi:hypothetical protein